MQIFMCIKSMYVFFGKQHIQPSRRGASAEAERSPRYEQKLERLFKTKIKVLNMITLLLIGGARNLPRKEYDAVVASRVTFQWRATPRRLPERPPALPRETRSRCCIVWRRACGSYRFPFR